MSGMYKSGTELNDQSFEILGRFYYLGETIGSGYGTVGSIITMISSG